MHISFFPTLGSHTRVPVGPPVTSLNRDDDGVCAAFTARLSPEDYAEAIRTGLRIEVWTNAPSGARPAGIWGPIAFEEVDDATDTQDAVVVPDFCFSQDAKVRENEPSSPAEIRADTHLFWASIALPSKPGRVFEFTYRLVYPGGICWLGSDRDNGIIELDEGSAFFEEKDGVWDTRGEKRVLAEHPATSRDLQQCTDEADFAVVCELNMFEWTWRGWATDGSRSWSLDDNDLEAIQEARIAFLVPSSSRETLIQPQPHVFCAASKDAPFSVSSQGQVILQSCRRAAGFNYWLYHEKSEDDVDALRDAILSLCSAPYVFPSKSTDVIVFTPNYDTDAPAMIHAHSLTRLRQAARSISFPITSLDSFTKRSPSLSLFIPDSRSAIFVDRSDNPANISLRIGSGGARVIVSAVYDLIDDSKEPPKWELSLPGFDVAPQRVTTAGLPGNPLPTPPASPQAKPQRTVSFVLPIEPGAHRVLRHRRPVTAGFSDDCSTQRNESLRRAGHSGTTFQRFQAASGGEKVKLILGGVFRLLARFMSLAVLRFVLFVLRLIGGGGLSREEARITADERSDASPLAKDGSVTEKEADKGAVSSANSGDGAPSSVQKDAVESLPLNEWNTVSPGQGGLCMDLDQQHQHSIGHSAELKPVPPALRWLLPGIGATPIRLVVRSSVAPEDISKHLRIELNNEDVVTKGWSCINGAGSDVNVIEIACPRDVPEPSTFVVKLCETKERLFYSYSSSSLLSGLSHCKATQSSTFLSEQHSRIIKEMRDIDNAKRRYSQELAAYTYEQWRLARTAWESAQASSAVDSAGTRSSSESSNDSTASQSDDRLSRSTGEQEQQHREHERALRTVDYAHKAPLVNGTA